MVKREKFTKMGRRRFLQTLAGTGVSATTLGFATPEAVAAQTDDLTNEIPYVAAIKRTENEDGTLNQEPIYETITPQRLGRIKAVENAARAISRTLDRRFDLDKHISVGMKTLKSRKTYAERGIYVDIRTWKLVSRNEEGVTKKTVAPPITKEDLERHLPSTVRGQATINGNEHTVDSIPVIVDDMEVEQTASFNSKYRPVSGGCQICHKNSLLSTKVATSGCRASDQQSYDYVMMTAGHALEKSDGAIRQPVSDNVGTPGRYKNVQENEGSEIDAGFFNLDSETSVDDTLATSNGDNTTKTIAGIRSWEWIKNDGPVEGLQKQGRSTGATSGPVIKSSIENNENEHVFFIDANQKGGDSGGPMYSELDDYFYIAGLAVWEGGGNGGGNAASHIEDKLDVTIY